MAGPTADDLDRVLGEGPGDTAEERALHSSREYIRSMDQLAEPVAGATGRRLTASEALDAYGWDILAIVADEGAALLSAGPKAAGRLLADQRERLRLDIKHVAVLADVDIRIVEQAEAYKRLPIRELEKIARALGLDEQMVSWREEPSASDQRIGIRLRTIGDEHPRMTPGAVGAIAEAAWVASKQLSLQRKLDLSRPAVGIEESDNYGGPGYPSYEQGYFLAYDARQKLGLGDGPIGSFRQLAEDRLAIPVIQTEMGPSIAGVTLEIGIDRAIVVNLDGRNRHVLTRRSTLSHELGHLLFDPHHRLEALRVDDYEDLDLPAHRRHDAVEQRANAFAVEFIALRREVETCYRKAGKDPLFEVMNTFGLSYTAARYHIWNALEREVPFDQLVLENPGRRIDTKWEASESFTVDFHPLHGVRPSRAGRFSAIVVRAADEGLISVDTAAVMLEVSTEEIQGAKPALMDLFPSVFPSEKQCIPAS